MQNTNGAQGQPGFAGQQTANAHGMNPSMPSNNNNSRAPPVMFGAFHRQQGPSQAQPQLYGQQTVNGNRVPINFAMRAPNNNGAPVPVPRSNAQMNQQALPVRPGFGVPQMGNTSRGNSAMAIPTNANAINGFTQMYSSGHQQPYAQLRAPQYHQARQNQQAPQTFLGGEAFNAGTGQTNYQSYPAHPATQPANPSSSHLVGYHNGAQLSQNASLPTLNTSTSNVNNAARSQTPVAAETPEEFEDRVADLVAENATTFKAYIQSDADFDRYEAAVWKAKWKGDDLKDMSEGFPTDEASLSAVKQRIFDAFLKTDGDQDPASDSDDFNNCLAVRTIQKLSDIELEILAHKFTVSTIGI